MILESTFGEEFAGEGQLKRQWEQAQMAPDAETSLIFLRQVQQQLQVNSAWFAHLWLPFLNMFLDKTRLHALTSADLAAAEEMSRIFVNNIRTQNSSEEIWGPLVNAYEVRGEKRQARTLLIHIYHAPFTRREGKIWSACELAQRGASGDEHTSIYIDYLLHVEEPSLRLPVLNTLASICSVDFDTDNVLLRRTQEVAQQLVTNNLQVAGVYRALGIYTLLIEQSPSVAVKYFIQALQANGYDIVALRGLLAAWIQSRDYDHITKTVQWLQSSSYSDLTDPIMDGLINLNEILHWLDSSTLENRPARGIYCLERLKSLNLQKYVGDVIDIAIGRFYLIEGNAQQAKAYLHPLVAKHPEQPQWHYYAAWADILVGDQEALVHRFTTLTQWSGKWTIGCLLIDIDPATAAKNDTYAYLKDIAKTKAAFASIIEARMALAQATQPYKTVWNMDSLAEEPSGSLEEFLEALRTSLGYAISKRDIQFVEQLMNMPLFQRLPLADQLMWRGLHSLLTGEQLKGRSLLEEAASKFGYQRAAFVLTVYLLEQNMLSEAKRFLKQATAHRTDTKVTLLLAYLDECDNRIEVAATQLKKLASQQEARAHYALGNLYLRCAENQRHTNLPPQAQDYYREAERSFTEALKARRALPDDCDALARCTSFVVSPDTYTDIWSKVQQLGISHRQKWFMWHAILARFWHGHPSDMVVVCQEASRVLQYAEHITDIELEAFTRVVIRASNRVENQEQADAFIKLLQNISSISARALIKHLCHRGIAITAHTLYKQVSDQQREQALQYIVEQVRVDGSNVFLALFLACIYCESSDQKAAVSILRNAHPLENLEQYSGSTLVEVLTGSALSLEKRKRQSPRSEPKMTVDYTLLKAASAFLAEKPVQGSEMVLTALEQDQEKTASIIKLERLFPSLYVQALKKGTISPQLLKAMKGLEAQGKGQQAAVARRLVALGEMEQACKLWKQIVETEPDKQSPLRQEFAKLLCHLAVLAYTSGNKLEAIQKLREAAQLMRGTEQGQNYQQRADALELQLATHRLITIQFPDMDEMYTSPGRYHCLELIITQHSRLIKDVLMQSASSKEDIKGAWGRIVKKLASDVRFLHIRAVIYRDHALANLLKQEPDEFYLISSTGLWILLLCSEQFWVYFSEARVTNASGERQSLTEFQQEELFHDALNRIFALHSTFATQAFATEHYEHARIHLHCLNICRQGKEKLIETLQEYRLDYPIPTDDYRLAWATKRANSIFEEWCTKLVREAESVTKDADAIKALPDGIRKNYEGGIRILEPFIKLNIPVVRVLNTCLDWYNEWFFDLRTEDKFWSIYALMDSASTIAEQLIPLCIKGFGYKPENQILSEHFRWKFFLSYNSREQIKAIEEIKEALAWNPANEIASRWLKEIENGDEDEGEDEYDNEEGEDEDEDGYDDEDGYGDHDLFEDADVW
jgi:hypothetical protein